MIQKLVWTALAALVLASVVSGCNTMRGIGQDVSSAGHGIQRAASGN